MKDYRVNEVFRSPQGEGQRVGTDNVFVRFTGCNLRCAVAAGPKSPGGFDCDTEFESGRRLSLADLMTLIDYEAGDCRSVILTGGEPLLQTDGKLLAALKDGGYFIALETNGTKAVPEGVDYVAVSPKVAEHALCVRRADEVRYVRGHGQALPKTRILADHYFVSPAFIGNELDERALEWCKQLCEGNDKWKVSVQMHKLLGVR